MLGVLIFFILLGCLVSWLITYAILNTGVWHGNNRESQYHHTHSGIIPRIGGVGMATAFGLVYLLCFAFLDHLDNSSLIHYAIVVGGIGAFFLGFIDDYYPLSAKLKFFIQVLLALLAYASGLSIERVGIPFTSIFIELNIFGVLITVIWFVAIMNLMNLIDGLDGLAGGIGLMLMLLLVYLSIQKDMLIPAILSLGMTGACIGFLFHNFPPAKVYMGDSGAYLLGYVIAALSLMNAEKGTVLAALIAPMFALALPIADVGFAMLRRALQGLPIFRPDKGHIHHRLLRTGLSHRNAVLVLYSFSLLALLGGIMVFSWQGRYLPLFLGFAFALLLLILRGQKISYESMRTAIGQSLEVRQGVRNTISLQQWFITEVDRADSGIGVWSDYHFLLKKMGFCRGELEINGEKRFFYIPNISTEDPELLWTKELVLDADNNIRLSLYGERDNFSEAQFDLLCDIAAESWSRVSARWKELNGSELVFDAMAIEPNNYKAQRARNLYRPTY